MRALLLLALLALLVPVQTFADDDVPAEVQRLVPAGQTAIDYARGDVNRDGRPDYVVVLQRTPDPAEPEQYLDEPRTLLVLTRRSDGSLVVAGKGPKAVLCRDCGGVWGDPLNGVHIEPGRFTIEHYAGSNSRWTRNFTFAWSRRDQTWQLVEVETTSYHVSDADKVERTVHRPPKHFGKIDLADFDPDDYLGKGPK